SNSVQVCGCWRRGHRFRLAFEMRLQLGIGAWDAHAQNIAIRGDVIARRVDARLRSDFVSLMTASACVGLDNANGREKCRAIVATTVDIARSSSLKGRARLLDGNSFNAVFVGIKDVQQLRVAAVFWTAIVNTNVSSIFTLAGMPSRTSISRTWSQPRKEAA